ncbi:MAG TPA: GNAT family N-acetyltransferase [Verrucomicrobiota bacterium]|jgi:acyl-CoA hydrolase/GNAT superfamily N-acetyltransferase|nr:MAG: Succinyl-CoA:coenzyme A transferase [Verrucomicrobia bacterium ADurb.Bin118]HPY30680.1 GNAT family N-acetyltransferase [Verrucomicrobiota bacterium]HQB17068.1 GNAT family N-acetyltransferase [Verrucomicrobiota bacterium]
MTKSLINYDPAWKQKYASQVMTAEQAVKKIRPGQRIFVGTGCAEPQELVAALTQRARELPDTEIIHLLTFGDAPYAHRELAQYFRVNSFFIAENVRNIIQEGLGDYTPIHLSDIPRLFNTGQLPLDAALIQITPPDANGLCSLGVSVDIVKSAAENASLVIAQVNPNMPWTHGNSLIDVLELDALVPCEDPILEVPPAEINDVTRQIAEYVSSLVDDEATLELGIGKIPHSLLGFLTTKKDLGIHTEMITDDIIPLIEAGVVTGNRKTIDRGKVVASFCLGTRRLYDYVDNNPVFSFHPTEYVNNPYIISQQNKMVAVNVALEVDLTGQVCADSLGSRFFSGVGGQVDFNRGAAKAHGGKAIIALPSTARDGKVSRIVTRLSPGAGVVTTRAGVNYVVTEYGVAYLHGKSVAERALALISIAHPQFRAQLLREAIEAKYLAAELAAKEGKIIVGPKELRTTFLTNDGTQIVFRPIHPTDVPRMRDHFYGLSQQSIYYRFMQAVKDGVVPRRQIEDFAYIDHRNDVCIVGVLSETYGEQIIAIGSYYLNPKTNRAEVAFTVHDKWQQRGIGTFLLKHLMRIARRDGIGGFTAEVLVENKPMQAVFNKAECKIGSKLVGNVYHYDLEFA